ARHAAPARARAADRHHAAGRPAQRAPLPAGAGRPPGRGGGGGIAPTCAKGYDKDTRGGGGGPRGARRPPGDPARPRGWRASAGPRGVPVGRRIRRNRRRVLRRRIRTGALIALIGLVRLARVVRARPGLAFLLAGALLSVAGDVLSSGAVFIAGSLVFLRGAA